MTHCDDLPFDILLNVFRYLTQMTRTKSRIRAILQSQLTCKKWAAIVKPILYKTVTLKRIQQLETFTDTLRNPDIRPLIKYVFLEPKFNQEQLSIDDRFGLMFSTFIQQCSDLRGIRISDVDLETFVTYQTLENSIKTLHYIYFQRVTIDPYFLLGLSSFVNYISKLTLSQCDFTSESYREISMPDTEFLEILCNEQVIVFIAYLKVIKTVNNCTYWYMLQDKMSETCTEAEYQFSLRSRYTISIFIHCKNISKIKIILNTINVLIQL